MNKRVFHCSYGSNGAELSITKREYGDRLFMIVLSGDGFESHRDMTLDDMKDMHSWIGSAINATFKGENKMSESKHTPGPWRVEEGTTLIWGNCNPDDTSTRGMGYPIAEARINPSGNWSTGPYADEGNCNARVISAAPDLLKAAKNLLEIHGDGLRYGERISAFSELITAIAKAEGRS